MGSFQVRDGPCKCLEEVCKYFHEDENVDSCVDCGEVKLDHRCQAKVWVNVDGKWVFDYCSRELQQHPEFCCVHSRKCNKSTCRDHDYEWEHNGRM
jgi:hypothetical protein